VAAGLLLLAAVAGCGPAGTTLAAALRDRVEGLLAEHARAAHEADGRPWRDVADVLGVQVASLSGWDRAVRQSRPIGATPRPRQRRTAAVNGNDCRGSDRHQVRDVLGDPDALARAAGVSDVAVEDETSLLAAGATPDGPKARWRRPDRSDSSVPL
jgi:hypothetical protein